MKKKKEEEENPSSFILSSALKHVEGRLFSEDVPAVLAFSEYNTTLKM